MGHLRLSAKSQAAQNSIVSAPGSSRDGGEVLPGEVCFRAVLLFKLREAEKVQGLGEAIAKPSDGRGQGGGDIFDQVDDAITQASQDLRRTPLRTRLWSSPSVPSRR
jgi:hypothetical protein